MKLLVNFLDNVLKNLAPLCALAVIGLIVGPFGYEFAWMPKRMQSPKEPEPKVVLQPTPLKEEARKDEPKAAPKVETGSIPNVAPAKPKRNERAECELMRAAEIADQERKIDEFDKELIDCLAEAKVHILFRESIERRCGVLRDNRLATQARLAAARSNRC